MPSAVADGMDVLDMYRVAREASDRARNGEGPTLIEARTYRFVGHPMSDPVSGVYRTKEEVEEKKLHDPIRIYANFLADQGKHDDHRPTPEHAHGVLLQRGHSPPFSPMCGKCFAWSAPSCANTRAGGERRSTPTSVAVTGRDFPVRT